MRNIYYLSYFTIERAEALDSETRSDSPVAELKLTRGLLPTGMSRNPFEVNSAGEEEHQGPRNPPTALSVKRRESYIFYFYGTRAHLLIKRRTESL